MGKIRSIENFHVRLSVLLLAQKVEMFLNNPAFVKYMPLKCQIQLASMIFIRKVGRDLTNLANLLWNIVLQNSVERKGGYFQRSAFHLVHNKQY